jgi:hypothetical protein
MNKPKSCIECPACKFGNDVSTDNFDRAVEVFCGFTGKMIDSFYEHPGSEAIDKSVDKDCPLKQRG